VLVVGATNELFFIAAQINNDSYTEKTNEQASYSHIFNSMFIEN
jgi:hypothetical protein